MRRAGLALLASAVVAAALAGAEPASEMQITGYDDGVACPGGCDAHVVFHDVHNGTAAASDPASDRSAPRPCGRGRGCRVCFSADDASCLTAVYRGNGPGPGRLDFTPRFFAERCAEEGQPAALERHCAYLARQAAELAGRIDCFATPDHERCASTMREAVRRKLDDEARFLECRAIGEVAWNARHAEQPELQRSVACAYERQATAQGADGSRWTRLLDGACPPGSFAGRDGTDCCSGDRWSTAVTWPECGAFFAEP